MAKKSDANVADTLRNTILVYFNKGNRLGGFYKVSETDTLRVSGTWAKGHDIVSFNLVDEKTGAVRGECQYRKRLNPTGLRPIADGVMTVDGERTAVCVRPAAVRDETGTKVPGHAHTVFPDRAAGLDEAPF